MFAIGITRTAITARVGNQLGRGQVEFIAPQWDEQLGELKDRLTENPVEVFNFQGIEIPEGIHVSVTLVQDVGLTIVDFDKKCSVRIPEMASIFFLTEFPKDPKGLEVEHGAWIDIPPNVHSWPEGTKEPEQVLCRSRDDPKHYKLFKYHREIEGTDWEDTGLNFGGTFTAESWRAFARSMALLESLQPTSKVEGV